VSRRAVAAGLSVGGLLTWNVSNVGAVADPLAGAYGASLAAVGLLTTALFVTHLAVQLPAGVSADRLGARTVALAACAAAVLGNVVLLASDDYAIGLLGRLVVGIGSGAGFVAGLDLVRAGGGGPLLHGVYGGSTMAGGGLALMILPRLTEETSWRAPYWTAAALAVLAAAPVLVTGALPRVGHAGEGVLRDRRLLPLGVLQAATFGLAVVAGNWVVTLLERHGTSSTLAGLAGGLVLLAGIVTRPWGGLLARRSGTGRRRAVAASLVAMAGGAGLLAAGGPLAFSAVGALAVGLAAGVPFAMIFDAAQRLRPDAPGAAVALVNACAVLTILVGTPLAGLAFDLPGDGRLAFAAIGALCATALLALRFAELRPPPDGRAPRRVAGRADTPSRAR
jgi:MFS family permease